MRSIRTRALTQASDGAMLLSMKYQRKEPTMSTTGFPELQRHSPALGIPQAGNTAHEPLESQDKQKRSRSFRQAQDFSALDELQRITGWTDAEVSLELGYTRSFIGHQRKTGILSLPAEIGLKGLIAANRPQGAKESIVLLRIPGEKLEVATAFINALGLTSHTI